VIKSALSAVALVAAFTGAVSAADLVIEAPAEMVVDSSYDWSGMYVGGFAGYSAGDITWDFIGVGPLDVELSGWTAGLTLGANAQDGSFVYGVEGDIAWADIGGSSGCPPATYDCTTDIGWLGTLRGRAGFAADAFLVYATAGIAAAGVSSDSAPWTPGESFDETYFGWTAGAGVEVGVTEDISLKAEYLYTDLGSKTAEAGLLAAGEIEVPVSFHTVRVGANFHF
jgi:outer membrane immunogenic protein